MAKPRKRGARRETSLLRKSVCRAEESSVGSGSEAMGGEKRRELESGGDGEDCGEWWKMGIGEAFKRRI